MPALRLLALTMIAAALFFGCVKEPQPDMSPSPTTASPSHAGGWSALASKARYAGSDYSQSISLETANKLITSYLTSVNYPAEDTALRSLTFDADTLRAYLRDTSIVTLRFFVAHTPAYANNSATFGTYAGMKPTALTFVIAGLNSNDQYVRSSSNGFYEHLKPCPVYCTGSVGPLLQ